MNADAVYLSGDFYTITAQMIIAILQIFITYQKSKKSNSN